MHVPCLDSLLKDNKQFQTSFPIIVSNIAFIIGPAYLIKYLECLDFKIITRIQYQDALCSFIIQIYDLVLMLNLAALEIESKI